MAMAIMRFKGCLQAKETNPPNTNPKYAKAQAHKTSLRVMEYIIYKFAHTPKVKRKMIMRIKKGRKRRKRISAQEGLLTFINAPI